MKFSFIIELVKKDKRANLYSVRLSGSQATEFEKFINDPVISEHKDFTKLTAQLSSILSRYGCEDNFFRHASSPTDPVSELCYGKLRLYCAKWSKTILIAGGGGIKSTRTYQEDPLLNQSVELLKYVSKLLEQRIRDKEIVFDQDGFFSGDLTFEEES